MMVPEWVLFRLLFAALHRVPDQRVVLDDATLAAMDARIDKDPDGGLIIESNRGVISARLVDHEEGAISRGDAARDADVLVRGDGYQFSLQHVDVDDDR